jgi:hypothetical protein
MNLVAATTATSDDGLQVGFRVLLNELGGNDGLDGTLWIYGFCC